MIGAAANAPVLHQRLFDSAWADGYVTTAANGSERLTVAVPSMVPPTTGRPQLRLSRPGVTGCCPGTPTAANGR